MTRRPYTRFILAVVPTPHGFSFVLFEGPEAPFDWGTKDIRGKQKNAKTLDGVKAILCRYHPEGLILESTRHGTRRTARIRRLLCMLAHLADTEGITVARYTREDIRACFSSVGAKTKYEIAKAIANQIPAFMHRLPPIRKIWMSEDPRQSLFDAAALGISHYVSRCSAEGKEVTE
jgi:Holliday junction resolvasome RuvABC endonuclease subunit